MFKEKYQRCIEFSLTLQPILNQCFDHTVQENNTHAYTNVGWIVNSEVGYCMVCMVQFGIFTYPHHCKACGNLVCQKCSNNKVVIEEVKEIGRPLRVCVQCFFGQEVVNCIQYKALSPQPIPKVVETKVVDMAEEGILLLQEQNQTIINDEQQPLNSEVTRIPEQNDVQSHQPDDRKETIFGMPEVCNSDDLAITTSDNVDVTRSDQSLTSENAAEFASIYTPPQVPETQNSRLVNSTETQDFDDDDIDYEEETYLEVNSSKVNNLHTVIRVIVKPLSECNVKSLSFNHNFNDVLKDINLKYEYEYNDMILQPHAVGLLTAKQSRLREYTAKLASNGRLQGNNFPYIIGSINNLSDHLVQNQVAKSSCSNLHPAAAAAASIDVVIPSSLWKLVSAESDVAGEIRQNIFMRLQAKLTAHLPIEIENKFDAKKGYVSCNDGAICSVINLSEVEKTQFQVSFVGSLSKQGHGVKSWKKRLVHIVHTRMTYFDIACTKKGDFHINDCSLQNMQHSECNAPDGSFPFKLVNRTVIGSNYLYCHVHTEELRLLFASVFGCIARQMSIQRLLQQIPEEKRGLLKKQVHVLKFWKKQYFVLAEGMLYYFANELSTESCSGAREVPLGQFDLFRSKVKINTHFEDDVHDYKIIISEDDQELIVQAVDLDEKNKWFKAIEEHIRYANGQGK
eukprot:gene23074-31391_t